MNPEVMQHTLLSIQVCVPQDWNDAQVIAFAERATPCGTTNGWFVRKQGDDRHQPGDAERVPCVDRPGFVHVVLDA